MDIIKNKYTIQQYDDYDSVRYGQHKIKKYWNPKTKTYRVFDAKTRSAIWRDVDYEQMMDGKWQDMGRLLKLMQSCDRDNMLCVIDSNRHNKLVPINSEQQLMIVLDLKKRSWLDFKKKLDKADILKYITIKNADGTTYMRYYINPLVTMRDKGISIQCYKLFKESLDNVLSPKAIEDLNKHLLEENGIIDTPPEIEEKKDYNKIFAEYVLNDEPADTYINQGYGMVRGMAQENVWYTPNKIVSGAERKKENVIEYRNLYLDIDTGRDNDGNYYDLAEVQKRKESMQELICALPCPTAVIDTRNGYHIYYALEKNDYSNGEKWEQVEKKLVDEIVTIADRKAKDSVRLMRLPNSIHHKDGLEAYTTSILSATEVRYSLDTMESILDNTAGEIKASCAQYIEKYPSNEKTNKNRSAKKVNVNYDMSDRISDIANLTTTTFPILKESVSMSNNDEAKVYYQHQSLDEFLQIDNPSSFDCIFHVTEHGDGKSATIYAPDDDCDKYRYVCHCIDTYYDIIDCVMQLASVDYRTACMYLSRVYNVWIN
jgi:hypothetical protein